MLIDILRKECHSLRHGNILIVIFQPQKGSGKDAGEIVTLVLIFASES